MKVLYFFVAAFLLLGLLQVGGYIGHSRNPVHHYSPTANMSRLVTGNTNATSDQDTGSGGCTSCKWY